MNVPGSDRVPEDGGKTPFASSGPYLTIGAQLAFAVVVFFFLGQWLDTKFETTPWLTIVGSVLGITGGLMKFIRTAIQMGRREDREQHEHTENEPR